MESLPMPLQNAHQKYETEYFYIKRAANIFGNPFPVFIYLYELLFLTGRT